MWLLRMLLFFDVMLFEAAQVVIEKRQRARKRWSVLKTKLIVSIRFRKLTGYANQKATEHAEEVKTIRKQTRQAISQYKKRTMQKGGCCERWLGDLLLFVCMCLLPLVEWVIMPVLGFTLLAVSVVCGAYYCIRHVRKRRSKTFKDNIAYWDLIVLPRTIYWLAVLSWGSILIHFGATDRTNVVELGINVSLAVLLITGAVFLVIGFGVFFGVFWWNHHQVRLSYHFYFRKNKDKDKRLKKEFLETQRRALSGQDGAQVHEQKLEPDLARAKLNWANGVMPGAQVYEQKLEPDLARANLNWANGVMPGAQVYEQKLEPYLTREKLTWANDVMPVLLSEEWWDSIAENGHYYGLEALDYFIETLKAEEAKAEEVVALTLEAEVEEKVEEEKKRLFLDLLNAPEKWKKRSEEQEGGGDWWGAWEAKLVRLCLCAGDWWETKLDELCLRALKEQDDEEQDDKERDRRRKLRIMRLRWILSVRRLQESWRAFWWVLTSAAGHCFFTAYRFDERAKIAMSDKKMDFLEDLVLNISHSRHKGKDIMHPTAATKIQGHYALNSWHKDIMHSTVEGKDCSCFKSLFKVCRRFFSKLLYECLDFNYCLDFFDLFCLWKGWYIEVDKENQVVKEAAKKTEERETRKEKRKQERETSKQENEEVKAEERQKKKQASAEKAAAKKMQNGGGDTKFLTYGNQEAATMEISLTTNPMAKLGAKEQRTKADESDESKQETMEISLTTNPMAKLGAKEQRTKAVGGVLNPLLQRQDESDESKQETMEISLTTNPMAKLGAEEQRTKAVGGVLNPLLQRQDEEKEEKEEKEEEEEKKQEKEETGNTPSESEQRTPTDSDESKQETEEKEEKEEEEEKKKQEKEETGNTPSESEQRTLTDSDESKQETEEKEEKEEEEEEEEKKQEKEETGNTPSESEQRTLTDSDESKQETEEGKQEEEVNSSFSDSESMTVVTVFVSL
eukprot:g1361.t1